jgi:hypothetical protein
MTFECWLRSYCGRLSLVISRFSDWNLEANALRLARIGSLAPVGWKFVGRDFHDGIRAVSELTIGTVLIAAEIVRSIPPVLNEASAEGRANRPAELGNRPDDSRLKPPADDIRPTSDI